MARQLTAALFADLPNSRRRELTSAVAHYVAGVLDRKAMAAAMDELCRAADCAPGDRVKTLRGTTRGIILRMHPDGRVVWRPDNSTSELTALPETLLKE